MSKQKDSDILINNSNKASSLIPTKPQKVIL